MPVSLNRVFDKPVFRNWFDINKLLSFFQELAVKNYMVALGYKLQGRCETVLYCYCRGKGKSPFQSCLKVLLQLGRAQAVSWCSCSTRRERVHKTPDAALLTPFCWKRDSSSPCCSPSSGWSLSGQVFVGHPGTWGTFIQLGSKGDFISVFTFCPPLGFAHWFCSFCSCCGCGFFMIIMMRAGYL